jgi:predicted DNA-binding antitoxin AbrB/MazE fold protein
MATTVRALVKHGRLVPLKKVKLPEGEEVTLTIAESPSSKDVAVALRAAGGWKGLVDSRQFLRDVYRSRRRISRRQAPRL